MADTQQPAKIKKTTDDFRNEGLQAFKDGKSLTSCPYPSGTSEESFWKAGYKVSSWVGKEKEAHPIGSTKNVAAKATIKAPADAASSAISTTETVGKSEELTVAKSNQEVVPAANAVPSKKPAVAKVAKVSRGVVVAKQDDKPAKPAVVTKAAKAKPAANDAKKQTKAPSKAKPAVTKAPSKAKPVKAAKSAQANGSGNHLSDKWKKVLRDVAKLGIVDRAKIISIATKHGAKPWFARFVDDGTLERVERGKFRVTKNGEALIS